MKKRILSVLLAVFLLANVFSAAAAAKPEDTVNAEDFLLAYKDVDFEPSPLYNSDRVGALFASENSPDTAETVPTEYSSVTNGKITSAKHQGSYGTCWAFSASSAAEASTIINEGKTYDLSELQLAYFFYHKKIDPLGNATGDENRNISSKTSLAIGGNNLFTMWSLASWTNATTETVLPYTDQNCKSALAGTISDSYAYKDDVAHLQNAYIIPYGTDSANMKNIKQAIMKYGSVACSYYHTDSDYYSSKGSYYTKTTGTNHAVAIVGWNDGYETKNFGSSTVSGRPSSPGAWLVKNSWGTNWGTDGDSSASHSRKEGYFWLSYYDASLISSKNVFAYDYYSADRYKYNYQYDGSCGTNTTSVSTTQKVAAVYTVKGLTSDFEKLEAVGIGVKSTNTSGTVYIYTDPEPSNPASGTLVAQQPFSTVFEGYHTVKLDTCPVLEKGQTYSVVVKFNTSVSIYVDASYKNGTWLSFIADTSKDKTYLINTSRSTVTNLGSSGKTARIKAFTNDTPSPYKQYAVSFDANGGINPPDTVYKYEHKDLTLPSEIPTRTGYNFLGWATTDNAAAAQYAAGGAYKTNADVTLYAVWEKKKATALTISESELQLDEGMGSDYVYINATPNDAICDWTVNGAEKSGDSFLLDGLVISADGNFFSVAAEKYVKDTVLLTFHDNNSGREVSCTVTVEPKATVARALNVSPVGYQLAVRGTPLIATVYPSPYYVDCAISVQNASYDGSAYYKDGLKITPYGNEFTVEALYYVTDFTEVTFYDAISGKTAVLSLYISPAYVDEVTLSQSGFSLNIGEARDISVSFSPDYAIYDFTVDGTDDEGPVYHLDGLKITKKSDTLFTVEAEAYEANYVLLAIYDTYTVNYDICLVHIHNYNEESWKSDGNSHWHECRDCLNKTDIADHTYSNPCDTDCDICGAIREVPKQPYSDGEETKYAAVKGYIQEQVTEYSDGWYILNEDAVFEDMPLVIKGDVTFILADGATLTANSGIALCEGNSLTVFAQSEGENAGKIIAAGGNASAGIGGTADKPDAGVLILNGGIIEATGGEGAAGIGGGCMGKAGELIINRVTSLTARGFTAFGAGEGAEDDTLNVTVSDALMIKSDGVGIADTNGIKELTVSPDTVKYLGISLTVSDELAVNFHMSLTEKDAQNGVMTFTVGEKSFISAAKQGSGGYYFSCALPLEDSAEQIKAKFSYAGKEYTYETSLAAYKAAISAGDYGEEIKALVERAGTDSALAGDVNGDGRVNVSDCVYIKLIISGDKAVNAAADINYDGTVNAADAKALAEYIVEISDLPEYTAPII